MMGDKQIQITPKEMFYQRNILNPYSSESQSHTAYEKGFEECFNTFFTTNLNVPQLDQPDNPIHTAWTANSEIISGRHLMTPGGFWKAVQSLQDASQPSIGMPSLDKPILTDEDVRAWEESETSRPPAGFEKTPFDPNRLKRIEGHEERAEKSWEEIQKRLAQQPAVKGAENWVKIGPTTDPTKTGVYKVRAYDTLHNDGAYLYGSCAYNNEVEEWNANWDEWLDESAESPTAAGDGKEAIEFADWIAVQGYRHLDNGVWAQEGIVNSLTTTAQLYDYYLTDKNK